MGVVQQEQVVRRGGRAGGKGRGKETAQAGPQTCTPQFMDLQQHFANGREDPFQSQKTRHHQKSCGHDTSSDVSVTSKYCIVSTLSDSSNFKNYMLSIPT